MWRLIVVGILIAGLACGVVRVLHAQEQNAGTAERLKELRDQASVGFESLSARVLALETLLNAGPAAPFTCVGTKSGIYLDTTCNQICVCNPVAGQLKWGRSDTGVLGSDTDCCA